MRLRSRRPWLLALYAVGLVLLVGGTGVAGACKLFLDCGTGPQGVARLEGQGAGPMKLPPDVKVSTYAQGLPYPTDLAFFPDGRLLVATKDGLIRIVAKGGGSATTFLDLRAKVNIAYFRGIMDVTVDADYPAHPFVYVGYVAVGSGRESTRPTVVRLSRFVVRNNRAVPASERIIVGSEGTTSCSMLPDTADCLPSEVDHDGLAVSFTPGGELFVSTGDGGGEERVEEPALLAQDIDTLGGKVLRVDRNGNGLADNPFWDGNPRSNRSRVWAFGLRNPFRMTLVPGREDAPLVADVGWNTWERLVFAARGANLGWPCFEAAEKTPKYSGTAFCKEFYRRHPSTPTAPWVALRHPQSSSITGGVALESATALSSRLRSEYVFADWARSVIYLVPSTADSPAPVKLAVNAAGPVAFAIGPDGALYYAAANVGAIRKLTSPAR